MVAAAEAFIAQARPSRALAQARQWCASPDWRVQAAGLDVLAALVEDHPQAVPALLEHAEWVAATGNSEDLRWSAAHALTVAAEPGSDWAEQLLAQLLRFETDEDGDVRWQVVLGLPDLAGERPDPTHPAVEALVLRLRDPDPEVRDWAAFGLVLVDDADSPPIRDALLEVLNDSEHDTAGEAAVALARRHDPRVLPVVLTQLSQADVGNLWVKAAAELADPALLPALHRLQADGWDRHDVRGHLLGEALDRVPCRPDATRAEPSPNPEAR